MKEVFDWRLAVSYHRTCTGQKIRGCTDQWYRHYLHYPTALEMLGMSDDDFVAHFQRMTEYLKVNIGAFATGEDGEIYVRQDVAIWVDADRPDTTGHMEVIM